MSSTTNSGAPRCLALRKVGGSTVQCKHPANAAYERQVCSVHERVSPPIELITVGYPTDIDSDVDEEEHLDTEGGGAAEEHESDVVEGEAVVSGSQKEQPPAIPGSGSSDGPTSLELAIDRLVSRFGDMETSVAHLLVRQDAVEAVVESKSISRKPSSVGSNVSASRSRKPPSSRSNKEVTVESVEAAAEAAEALLLRLQKKRASRGYRKLRAEDKAKLAADIAIAQDRLDRALEHPLLEMLGESEETPFSDGSEGESDFDTPDAAGSKGALAAVDSIPERGTAGSSGAIGGISRSGRERGSMAASCVLDRLAAKDSVVQKLASHGFPLSQFQLLDVFEAAVAVPWLKPADSYQVVDDADGELAFYAGVDGQPLTTKMKKDRPKRHASVLSWINAWTYHSDRVMSVTPPPRQVEVRAALSSFQALIVQLVRTNGWSSVSLYILAAYAIWRHGGVLVLRDLPAVWELVQGGFLGKVEALPDSFGISLEGLHDRVGVARPPFRNKNSCSACKQKGWTNAWCPYCKPTMPGVQAALLLLESKRSAGARANE